MVDGLHIPVWGEEGLKGRDDRGNVKNVQYKSNQNCHYKSPLYNEYMNIYEYNEYILIKNLLKKNNLVFCVLNSRQYYEN
jgi:hypothetical protein